VLPGAHVSTSGGIHTAIDRIEAIGGDSVQIFTQSPRMWRPTSHKPEAIEAFRAKRAEHGIGGVVCHALYLCNLAAPDDEIYAKSITTMRATVDAACAIGADGVVFHVGSHLGAGFEAGLEHVVPALQRALERCSETTWLLIENSAGAGGTVGRSVDELATIVDRLDRHPSLGVCLDSCHLYVSGVDVTDRAALDACVDEVEERIGLDRLRALHVNDAAASLGSNRDRHANLGEGEIGEGMSTFLAHPKLQNLPTILEVPGPDGHGPDAKEIQKLRDLHARGLKRAKPRRKAAARPRGKTASRGGARRTRD
jgi:deoxyribonuclease IV